jgi:predicted permease
MITEFLTRLRFLIFPKRRDELDDELRFHLEQSVAVKVAAGLSPVEARRQSRLEFGAVESTREQCNEQRPGWWIDTIGQDVRYALRGFCRNPVFSLTALATLALGIGANTAIYSILHGALRVPYPNSERMIAVQNVFPQGSYYAASYPDFLEWRAKSTSFSQLEASFSRRATWNGASFGKSEPEVVGTVLVSKDFFTLFDMKPVTGRDFLAAEHQPAAAPVCLVSELFWREELHADPSAIGKSLDLDSKSCTVVGVMPVLKPAGARPTAVWLPLETNKPWDQRGTNYLLVRGMLHPGITPAQAQAELATIQAGIDKQFPGNKHGVAIHSMSQLVFGDLRRLMQILLAAVGFILLIACVNVANMLLARASDREHEFALRRALGASSRRLLRQTMTESLLLSLAGAVAGIAVAIGLTHIPIAAWPKGFVAPSDVHLDGAILAFTGLLGIATGILAGCLPALRLAQRNERSVLQPNRASTESRSQGRMRSTLVISEIALCMLLVIGALDVAMRFASLLKVNPGVIAGNTLVMTVNLAGEQYATKESQLRFYHALADKLSTLPGVVDAGGSIDTPFSGSDSNGAFQYEGQATNAADKNPFAEEHYITPGYLAAIGAQVWQGRDFNSQDRPDAPQVVIINRTMAQKLWPGRSAIGKRIRSDGDGKWASIVGVVNDIQFDGPGKAPAFQTYRPVDQSTPSTLSFTLRTSPGLEANPLSLTEPARAAVASLDPTLAVSNITSLDILAQEAFAGQRTSATVMSVLGALALLLASIGIYGLMAYSVSRREREFGIRIALGASRARILRLLYSAVFRLVGAGMAIGALLAFLAHIWIASILGTQGTSPLAVALGGLLLSFVAVLAAAGPSYRAARVLPVKALRYE